MFIKIIFFLVLVLFVCARNFISSAFWPTAHRFGIAWVYCHAHQGQHTHQSPPSPLARSL